MEATILVGLLGAGYFLNSNDEKTPVSKNVDKTINLPSMENQYESDHYNQTQETLMKLLEKILRSLKNIQMLSTIKIL